MIFKKKTKVQLVVLSIGSLLLVTAGVSLAAATSTTLTFCANKSSGVLRYATNGKCKSNETKLQLNKQGPTGARGPAGPVGPAGPAATSTPGPTFQYAVGDIGPAGGVIFFVDTANQFEWFNYIETAPLSKYFANSTLSWDNWCYGSNAKKVGTSHLGGIGDGKAATNLMLDKCSYGAATVADGFAANSVTDWYLPSKGEAYLAFQTLIHYGWQFQTNDGYYTSTEKSDSEVWLINAQEMTTYFWGKLASDYVLPIRYFE